MKQDYGENIGSCNICGINLWDSCGGKPAIFPCGVNLCPYETKEQQLKDSMRISEFSEIGSSALQLMQET